jgi:hypothetical protein
VIPIELTMQPHREKPQLYFASWPDGEVQLPNIPESLLDLVPYMLARLLLDQGYNPARLLIVRLQGADYELMRAPLGIVAAKPRLSTTPVERPAHSLPCEGYCP